VTELPAFLTLGVLRGGEHLFHSPVPGEEVDGGEDGKSVGRGHGDDNGCCRFLIAGLRVRVEVTC